MDLSFSYMELFAFYRLMNLMWMLCPNTHMEKKRDFFREYWTMRYALSPRRCFQSDQIGKSGDVTGDVE